MKKECYFYGGIELISSCEGLIEYVTDSDIGGNALFILRELLTRIRNEKGVKEQEFEGVIPPIAEKEKRGKPVKRPKEETYVRELESKRDSINIPAAD